MKQIQGFGPAVKRLWDYRIMMDRSGFKKTGIYYQKDFADDFRIF